jgi:hypothetical protein
LLLVNINILAPKIGASKDNSELPSPTETQIVHRYEEFVNIFLGMWSMGWMAWAQFTAVARFFSSPVSRPALRTYPAHQIEALDSFCGVKVAKA